MTVNLRSLLAVLLLAVTMPAAAQPAPDPLRHRAEQVVALLQGRGIPGVFAPSFLAEIPPEQIAAISAQLRDRYGAAQRLALVERPTPASGTIQTSATIHVETERARVRFSLAIEPAAPHRIVGLVVTGADFALDSLESLTAELAALPGRVSFAAARLGVGQPARIAGHRPADALAIGSAFKLIVLAEASRQVRAGQRRWSDVVTLDRRSLPSGILQGWPAGSPLTLHTLATLMISISDNTATDQLIAALGRESVEAMMGRIGLASAARNRPFLTTSELFALKAASAADHHAWLAANEAGRRARLARPPGVSPDPDPARAGRPNRIDAIEWFASAEDLVKVMDWLRRHNDPDALAILAVNPGVLAARDDFAYIGFKGGSEPGVLNGTWLVRGRGGTWHAVAASWNNDEALLDQARFIGLMARVLAVLRAQ